MTDLSRPEFDARLAASEAKLDARLANFDASIKTGFAEMRADMAKLQADVHKNPADPIKWAIAIVGMTVGLLTLINKSAPQPATQASAPLVIAVPAGSALLNPIPQAPAAAPPPQTK